MEITAYPPGMPCWVDMGSPDMAASKNFYSQLLGWDYEDAGPESGGYQLATVRGKRVAGMGPQFQEGVPTVWTTYLAVADADATARSVRDAGGRVFLEPMDVLDQGRMAVFADPTGAVVAAWQPVRMPGSGLVNEPGAVCWNELDTRDPEGAKAFYGKVFGWSTSEVPMAEAPYSMWHLGDVEQPIGGMMKMGKNWPAEVPPHWMVCFAVHDADTAVEIVRELGGAVFYGPEDIGPGRFAVVADPHGAAFGVLKLRAP
ncbi:VOC family protein [Saccharopolyspora sp. K220]|uniref:VOC family protein n=1 Tax=Saccharopolyspora soli TaxID=2926618 RepID=UPI001F58A5E2|nr:VOC family protein [Saccharopolyspora soli]MCI2422772.1 VOC family protein [Saccharopolyspora soli]